MDEIFAINILVWLFYLIKISLKFPTNGTSFGSDTVLTKNKTSSKLWLEPNDDFIIREKLKMHLNEILIDMWKTMHETVQVYYSHTQLHIENIIIVFSNLYFTSLSFYYIEKFA